MIKLITVCGCAFLYEKHESKGRISVKVVAM